MKPEVLSELLDNLNFIFDNLIYSKPLEEKKNFLFKMISAINKNTKELTYEQLQNYLDFIYMYENNGKQKNPPKEEKKEETNAEKTKEENVEKCEEQNTENTGIFFITLLIVIIFLI